MLEIKILTRGEQFFDITQTIKDTLSQHLKTLPPDSRSGELFIHLPHTSAALFFMEGHEASAQHDVCEFLKNLAHKDLPFITHTTEGWDDSPSHMKALTAGSQIFLLVNDGKICLGQWQSIFLGEFRQGQKERTLWLRYRP